MTEEERWRPYIEVEPGQLRVLNLCLHLLKKINENGSTAAETSLAYDRLAEAVGGLPGPVVQRAISVFDQALAIALARSTEVKAARKPARKPRATMLTGKPPRGETWVDLNDVGDPDDHRLK